MTSDQPTPGNFLREPSLAELFGDPIMDLLLRRDGLRMEEVMEFLDTARQRLDFGRRAA